jgi:hypothetical protein
LIRFKGGARADCQHLYVCVAETPLACRKHLHALPAACCTGAPQSHTRASDQNNPSQTPNHPNARTACTYTRRIPAAGGSLHRSAAEDVRVEGASRVSSVLGVLLYAAGGAAAS